jgi:hypothetical protein
MIAFTNFTVAAVFGDDIRKILSRPEIQSLSSHSAASRTIFCSLDPLSDIGTTIFEHNAIPLAAGKKFNSVLVDERHIPQIQNQLFSRGLRVKELLQLLDVLCLNSSTKGEYNLTIR